MERALEENTSDIWSDPSIVEEVFGKREFSRSMSNFSDATTPFFSSVPMIAFRFFQKVPSDTWASESSETSRGRDAVMQVASKDRACLEHAFKCWRRAAKDRGAPA